ncbi:uncharacterized protein J3D65DRAFT_670560 [Phyllosticta citribraziliensis]|uniref:Uncharacterized protein n=1 Tax=Phyllosticta citribraziliensis TaxID=989973 RepID=A0ABR1LDP9_9PEZI
MASPSPRSPVYNKLPPSFGVYKAPTSPTVEEISPIDLEGGVPLDNAEESENSASDSEDEILPWSRVYNVSTSRTVNEIPYNDSDGGVALNKADDSAPRSMSPTTKMLPPPRPKVPPKPTVEDVPSSSSQDNPELAEKKVPPEPTVEDAPSSPPQDNSELVGENVPPEPTVEEAPSHLVPELPGQTPETNDDFVFSLIQQWGLSNPQKSQGLAAWIKGEKAIHDRLRAELAKIREEGNVMMTLVKLYQERADSTEQKATGKKKGLKLSKEAMKAKEEAREAQEGVVRATKRFDVISNLIASAAPAMTIVQVYDSESNLQKS